MADGTTAFCVHAEQGTMAKITLHFPVNLNDVTSPFKIKNMQWWVTPINHTDDDAYAVWRPLVHNSEEEMPSALPLQ